HAQDSTRPRSPAEKAWDRGDVTRARAAYLAELARHRQDDTAWYNAGTAALAGGDLETAQQALARAGASLEPDIRFRALYNLGLLALRIAVADSVNRDGHLAEAERAYREALLLNPGHFSAKWNLELAARRRGGGSSRNSPPPSGGGGGELCALPPCPACPGGRGFEPGPGRADSPLDRPAGGADPTRSLGPATARRGAGSEGLVTSALWVLIVLQGPAPMLEARVDRSRLPAGEQLTLTVRARSRTAEPVSLT